MHSVKAITLAIALTSLSSTAFAAPLMYVPTNPSFGGSPLNASTLLSTAAISRPKEKTEDTTVSASQQIANQIQSTVLAQVSSSISAQIYGEGAADSGSFDLGNGASIVFNTVGNNVVLVISGTDGSTTQLTLPKSTISF